MPYREKMQRGCAMSDDELIAEMRRAQEAVGRPDLTAKEFNRFSPSTHADALRKRFGGWHKALQRAEIGVSALGKRYTDLHCYENILSLWTHYGRQPRFGELKIPPSTVGPKAYVRRWGSWRGALAAFVQWANAEEADDPDGEPSTQKAVTPPTPSLAKVARLLPEDRHEIPLKLKWKVHLRDRFRCLACGRSPATHLNVALHADHIIPWAEGGKTIFENLQTLCQDCNGGKGKSFGKCDQSRLSAPEP